MLRTKREKEKRKRPSPCASRMDWASNFKFQNLKNTFEKRKKIKLRVTKRKDSAAKRGQGVHDSLRGVGWSHTTASLRESRGQSPLG
jgi:hypothetical protein